MKPTYGNKQSYLGLKFKITDDKNLEINMIDQINDILDESEGKEENVNQHYEFFYIHIGFLSFTRGTRHYS